MASSIQEIKIKIEYEDTTKGESSLKALPAPKTEVEEDKNVIKKSVIVHQSIDIAKDLLVQAVNTTASRYFSMKEDYMGENIYNITMTTLSKASKIGMSIVGGFLVGNIPGAIIGGIGSILGEAISLQGKYSSHFQTLNASNMSVDFARTRSGLIDNGRGTEN